MEVGTAGSEVAEQVATNEAAHEALESSIPSREIAFTGWKMPDGRDLPEGRIVFVQAPLGLMPTNEFTTMVTKTLNQFIEGEMGVRIGELFRGEVAMPTTFDADTVDKTVSDNIELIKAIFKFLEMQPELQLDIIVLSLGVPKAQRLWAKEWLAEPPHRGGLTVEDGLDILTWFIKQNVPMLKQAWTGKAQELVSVFRLEVMGQEPEEETTTTSDPADQLISSPGGTPSSTTAPPTPAID